MIVRGKASSTFIYGFQYVVSHRLSRIVVRDGDSDSENSLVFQLNEIEQ